MRTCIKDNTRGKPGRKRKNNLRNQFCFGSITPICSRTIPYFHIVHMPNEHEAMASFEKACKVEIALLLTMLGIPFRYGHDKKKLVKKLAAHAQENWMKLCMLVEVDVIVKYCHTERPYPLNLTLKAIASTKIGDIKKMIKCQLGWNDDLYIELFNQIDGRVLTDSKKIVDIIGCAEAITASFSPGQEVRQELKLDMTTMNAPRTPPHALEHQDHHQQDPNQNDPQQQQDPQQDLDRTRCQGAPSSSGGWIAPNMYQPTRLGSLCL